ncbi:MAG: barstar family protein [Gallionella sp.]|nr:barstar family protein [Gallionella sp.]MDD4946371.1 barstar family protein [Gallionella sp.]MDD5611727.1 barstar family protein [Gallionella sp.]
MSGNATARKVNYPEIPVEAAMTEVSLVENFVPRLESLADAACLRIAQGGEALREAAGEAGYVYFEADLKGIKGKKNLLIALAQAVEYPDEFGANWDALVDVLCDFSWHPAPGYVLLLRNVSPTLGLSAYDREIAQDILDDTVVYWRQRNKPFWIFLG